MTKEKLKLKTIIKKDNHNYYTFVNSKGKYIELKVFGDKSFIKYLIVGVVGEGTYLQGWLNYFTPILEPFKTTPKQEIKEKVKELVHNSPFDKKNENILIQTCLKLGVEIMSLDSPKDSPILPNQRVGLVKHYTQELYHYVISGEYKDLEIKFIDGDEVINKK